ncbi:MAG: pirin family protein [Spongiibacteraceae bacterium]
MAIAQILQPHEKDLGGGFRVRRLLPAATQRAIGPFIFFDHMGPVSVRPSDNFDVRPHPHINLATVTYLFEGAMMHRDSLGSVQRIEPGAINWMTAGSGIVHSERRPADLADREYRLHGLQLWAALPEADEECAPAFNHTPAAALPIFNGEGFSVRVLIGSAFGLHSPVATFSETLYLDIDAQPGAIIELDARAPEMAIYVVSNAVKIDGVDVPARQMAVLDSAQPSVIESPEGARCVIIGGAPLGYRHMVWNFVSTRRERIEQAKTDWAAQRFVPVPGEHEFIPLPTNS